LIAHHFTPLCLKNLIRALFYPEGMQASIAAGENTNREPPSHYTNILPLSFRDKSSKGGAFFSAAFPAWPAGCSRRGANRFRTDSRRERFTDIGAKIGIILKIFLLPSIVRFREERRRISYFMSLYNHYDRAHNYLSPLPW
jgi:hypothetical protein